MFLQIVRFALLAGLLLYATGCSLGEESTPSRSEAEEFARVWLNDQAEIISASLERSSERDELYLRLEMPEQGLDEFLRRGGFTSSLRKNYRPLVSEQADGWDVSSATKFAGLRESLIASPDLTRTLVVVYEQPGLVTVYLLAARL